MPTKPESFSNTKRSVTGLDRWLAGRGLERNPFERWNAEHDQDLPKYFVDIGGFDELLSLTEPCVVFAQRGCGKTAQRQMLAAHCRPLKRDSLRLAIAYTYNGFEQAIGSANGDTKQILPIHHVSALLHLGLSALASEASQDTEVQSALRGPNAASRLAAYATRFAPHLSVASATGPSSALDQLGSLALLQGFTKLIRDAGLELCVVFLDGLDEFPLTADDPTQAVMFLAPLLGTLPLIECPGLAFKFFLPQELEPALRVCGWFRVDRLRVFRITWNESNLLALIRQRLTHFSQRVPPYEGLGQLCEDELAQVIDSELVALAEGSPRTALILANMLVQRHGQQSNPPDLITLRTWEQVKAEWQTRRDDFVVERRSPDAQPKAAEPVSPVVPPASGYPALEVDEEKHLIRLGERDITAEIGAQEYHVLVCLYRYQDRVCSKDLLVEKAWSEAARAGVTDQAIAASIARLRRTLGQSSPEKGYIETVRGHGYRLHPEGFETSKPVN
jgi:DNA-binding winged helix-turn-helix (wHTH) protein